MLDFHWCNNLIQCYTPLPDELWRQKYSPKYEFSHFFPHIWPRNRLCASLTEQALRTCLGLPGSELVLSWLTVAIGHMTDVQPSPVNPMDKWKASRPGSPCKTNHSPLDLLKVGEEVVSFLTFSCRLTWEKQTVMRRKENGVLGELKTNEEEKFTMSTILYQEKDLRSSCPLCLSTTVPTGESEECWEIQKKKREKSRKFS